MSGTTADRDDTPEPLAASLPELRGEREPDLALIHDVVGRVNRIYIERGLEMSRELGELIVDAFFDGDLDAARHRSRDHASWRALAGRADLLVSHSSLWFAVRMLDQLRELPDDVGARLSISHHRRLAAVRDPDAKAQLAEAVLTESLTVRQLEDRISEHRASRADGARRGRKPLPTFVKSIRALRKLDLTGTDVSEDAVRNLDAAEADDLLEAVEQQLAALAALRTRIADGRR